MQVGAFGGGPDVRYPLTRWQSSVVVLAVVAMTAPNWIPDNSCPSIRLSGLTLIALSAVQPDLQGVASLLLGSGGSLPQSWEGEAGWVGTVARQRQSPDPTNSHASSTADVDLVRTALSLQVPSGNVK